MMNSDNEYTDAFKRDVVQLLNFTSKNGSELELALGIPAGLLVKWRRQFAFEDAYGKPYSNHSLRLDDNIGV
ncbi:MAG: transposase [Chloroflexota bacterium]